MENYGIGFKYQSLTNEEQVARLALIDRVILLKRELSEEEAMEICGDKNLYEELKGRNIIGFMDGLITFLYPVSAVPTHHRVKLSDGREFYSMCAVDALGASSMFHLESEIYSVCSESGDKIYVKIEDGRIKEYSPENLCVLHVDLEKESNWAAEC